MNKKVTCDEDILTAAKGLVASLGMQNLNMRAIAKICDVSVGSIYNYFPTKNDLIVAVVESIWKEIIQGQTAQQLPSHFVGSVECLFVNIQNGSKIYHSFFDIHSLNMTLEGKEKGRERMDVCFSYVKDQLLSALNADRHVKSQAFSEDFTKDDFIDFIWNHMLMLLSNKQSSCDFLLEVIQRLIY